MDDNMEEYIFRSSNSGFIFIVKKEDFHYDIWINDKSISGNIIPRKKEFEDDKDPSVIKIEVEQGQRVRIKKVHKLSAHRNLEKKFERKFAIYLPSFDIFRHFLTLLLTIFEIFLPLILSNLPLFAILLP